MRDFLLQLQRIWRYYRIPHRDYPSEDVFNAVGLLFQWNAGFQFKLLDTVYTVVTQETWENTLRNFWVQQRTHVLNRYDCEDFSFWLKSWASGLGYTAVGLVLDDLGEHAYNVVVLDVGGRLVARLVEPQTTEFGEPRQGLYQMETGIVLL